MIAVVVPGSIRPSVVTLSDDGAEVARLEAEGGLVGLVGLVELAAESFGVEVEAWRLDVAGFGSAVLHSPSFVEASVRLGIRWERVAA